METELEKRNVVVTRTFDAPPEKVWRAWSEGEQVRQWWGPQGFTCPRAEMDFRQGGVSLVAMRAPAEFGSQDSYNTWTYQKIVPHERIEFTLRFTDSQGTPFDPVQAGMPAGIPASVPHVITFRPVDGGRTEMTVTEYGYTSESAHDLSKAGLEQCLDKLAASLQ